MLAKKGIQTHLIDSGEALDDQPRATHYGTPAVHELARARVLDDIQAEGLICRKFCWRKLDGEVIAGLDSTILDGSLDQVTRLPVNQVSKITLKHVLEQPTAKVSWEHNVVDIGRTEEEAWVEVDTRKGKKRLSADYIVGCDGARSIVRRKLFGADDFPGHTLDEQIVATNVGAYIFDCVSSLLTHVCTGVLRLRQVRLSGFELHCSPQALAHGCQDFQRWSMESLVW